MLMVSSRTSGAIYLRQDSGESRSQRQDYRPACHYLPFGAHALVWGYIDGVRDGFVADSQAQVGYGAHAVFLNQDVL